MTSWRVMAGFAAGAALAGMIVGAARVTGVADPATAVAEEPPPASAAPPVADPAPPIPSPDEQRWRKTGAPSEVPAGVLARVASRRELERAGRCAPVAGHPAAAGDAGRCPPEKDHVENVEIEWHGSSPSR